jgi:hypothetical protein
MRIVAMSQAHPGSVHDMTIWNGELDGVFHLLDRPVLGDKAYAGAVGEHVVLLRPVRRNERACRDDKETAKRFNRTLSRRRVRDEHVFARLKTFRVLRDVFPFHPDRLGTVFAALAFVNNAILDEKARRSGYEL